EIEGEARPEQDVTRVTHVRNTRVAECADEDRVELVAKLRVPVRGHRDTGLQVVVRAVREHLEVEPAAETVADGLDPLDGFGGYIDPDAVAGYDGDAHRPASRRSARAGAGR